jgi:hypothetical protein
VYAQINLVTIKIREIWSLGTFFKKSSCATFNIPKTTMLKHTNDITEIREILLAILSNSGTLAGISLALVGIMNVKPDNSKLDTITDDLYIFSALGFVIVCYLVFFAMRLLHTHRITYLVRIIDVLFLGSLTMLVVAGFFTVYTFV